MKWWERLRRADRPASRPLDRSERRGPRGEQVRPHGTPPSTAGARPHLPDALARRPEVPEAVAMIARQILAREAMPPLVVAAMARLDRRLFVAPGLASEAWDDGPLPIGGGQTISQPYIVASMTALLDLAPHHRVLEVGTGSGYQCALLALLAGEVVTIERHPELAREAAATLRHLALRNVTCLVGDGTLGCPARAPFDRILVTAAASAPLDPLVEQLAPGGIMLAPVEPGADPAMARTWRDGWQRLRRWRRADEGEPVEVDDLYAVRFVPLVAGGVPPAPLDDPGAPPRRP